MDINQIKFGALSIGTQTRPQQGEVKESEGKTAQAPAEGAKQVSADSMLNAMNLVGMQNFAQIAIKANSENSLKQMSNEELVNWATNNIGADRAADIEASMANYDSRVESNLSAVQEEIPGISDKTAYAIAGEMN